MNKMKLLRLLTLLTVLALVFVPINAYAAKTNLSTNDKKIKLSNTKKTLRINQTYQIKIRKLPSNYSVTYESEDTSVAQVNVNGLVTSKAKGTSKIKVSIYNDDDILVKKLRCNITVTPSLPYSLKVLGSQSLQFDLATKTRLPIRTSIKPKSIGAIPAFRSLNPSVATVDSYGYVTPVSVGSTTIAVSVINCRTIYVKVTVTNTVLPTPSATPMATRKQSEVSALNTAQPVAQPSEQDNK